MPAGGGTNSTKSPAWNYVTQRPSTTDARTVLQATHEATPPTVVTRYVDTASVGGNGTTAALTGANAAYASLNAALTAMQGTNWASLNQQPQIFCAASTGVADTTTAAFSATWVGKLSPACFLEIVGDQPNALQYDATKYRIEVANTGALNAFLVSDLYLRVSRVGVKGTIGAGAGSVSVVNISVAGDVRLDRLHVWGVVDNGRTSVCDGVRMATTAGGVASITNTMVRGFAATGGTHIGFLLDQSLGDVVAYNCASVDNASGFTGAASVVVKNCGASGAVTPFVNTFGAASTNNAGNTATTPPGSNPRASVSPTFVDAAGGDYHLASTDTAWRDQGADLSADARYPFATDGDGETRSGTWDIGADEYVAALTNYALPADAGSYTVTGGNATARRTAIASANAGAYAITGATATTRAARAVGAVAGSYTLAGAADAFRRTYVVQANAGAYTLTGTAATPRAARRLASSAGAYTVGGVTASLSKGFALASGAGAYAVTGSAATARVARVLPAAGGVYTIAGGGASLDYSHITAFTLIAGAGAYAVVGSNADVRTTRMAALDGGAYAAGGAAAGLAVGRVLRADAGAYTTTGAAADLAHTERLLSLAAEAGHYETTGADASLIQRFLTPPAPAQPTTGGGGGGIVVVEQRVVERMRDRVIQPEPPAPPPMRIVVEVPAETPEPPAEPESAPASVAAPAEAPSAPELPDEEPGPEVLAAPLPEFREKTGSEQPEPPAESAPVVQPSPVTTIVAETPAQAAAALVREIAAQAEGVTYSADDLVALATALALALED